jgi:hypothetical protein
MTTLDGLLRCQPAFPCEVQDPNDERSAREEWERKFCEQPRPIRDSRDLLIAVGDFLASLTLEPDLQASSLDFLFLGRRHRLSLIDLDRDVEETLRGQGDRNLLAAGLPVG